MPNFISILIRFRVALVQSLIVPCVTKYRLKESHVGLPNLIQKLIRILIRKSERPMKITTYLHKSDFFVD